MTPEAALSIQDLRRLCQRRLPRPIFEGIESGVDDERGLAWNQTAFQTYRLLPRHLVDVRNTTLETALFGRRYASPFGVCPIGIVGLFRRGAERMLAEAASAARVPFVISGTSMIALEELARINPQNTWYQLYPARDPKITTDLLRRARDAGIETLVLTVDTPTVPNRERDLRNGFVLPPRIAFRDKLEALRHPAWLSDYLLHGLPVSANWQRYAPAGASAAEVFRFIHTQHPVNPTWHDVETLRAAWRGRFVVKGLTHPADAVRCADLGVDGVWLSNHGGKALDRAPAPVEMLPAVKAAVGDRVVIMMDSGIRRGSDIVVARCLGADFTWIGRAALYGAIAGATGGAQRAIEILQREIAQTLAFMGCPDIAGLSHEFILDHSRGMPSIGASNRHPMPAALEDGRRADAVS